MSQRTDRTDSILDAIDELVDESLSRGDQSGSFNGERYDRCTWCTEGWHALPITSRLREMRYGSYARDEFGQGIVDPDYSYDEDTSDIVCPGSQFRAPPTSDREWEWCKKNWGRPFVTFGQGGPIGDQGRLTFSASTANYNRDLPSHGSVVRARFNGPFDDWTIALNDERLIEAEGGLPHARQRIMSQSLTAVFQYNQPMTDPAPYWFHLNGHDVEEQHWIRGHSLCYLRDYTIPFTSFSVHGDPNQEYPDWIEFETTYPIHRHPWFASFWELTTIEQPAPQRFVLGGENQETLDHDCCDECSQGVYHHLNHGECNSGAAAMHSAAMRQGYESDYHIIDETHEHTNREVQEYVDTIQAVSRSLAAGASIPETFVEAPRQRERRPEVLRSREEDPPGQDRQVAAGEQARAIQEAVGAAFDRRFNPSGEAEEAR